MALQEGRTVLPPRQGGAFTLRKGGLFKITDLEGSQVSDLVVFTANDLTERFSPGNTRKLNNSLLLTTGSILWSNRCKRLLQLNTDRVGRHDITSSWCNPYDYPIRFGIEGHESCLGILTRVLAEFGIEEHMIPEPFNVFMKTDIHPETGAITVEESPSKPGDFIEMEALEDCIIGLTVCPQDQNACNGGVITPLAIEITNSRHGK